MSPRPDPAGALADLDRWLAGEIDHSELIESEALDEGDRWLAAAHDQRARTLREVRERLGATNEGDSGA